MSGYVTSGRFQRDCDRDDALQYRHTARLMLRLGKRNEHGYWMRRAIRYWRYYADAMKRERIAS